MPKIAVVVFPGSNCERDAFHVLGEVMGAEVAYHWHAESVSPDYAAVVLPGGFSYGDYLRAGALAKISPAVQSLGSLIDKGRLVMGICNGFQILCEAGYLPGALTKNRSLSFQCEDVYCRIESTGSAFLKDEKKSTVLRLPIAHSEGRYVAEPGVIETLKKEDRIALRYCSPTGDVVDEWNANGSTDAIAGITNKQGNVLGLMPHPERCSEKVLGNEDGLALFKSMCRNL